MISKTGISRELGRWGGGGGSQTQKHSMGGVQNFPGTTQMSNVLCHLEKGRSMASGWQVQMTIKAIQ